MELRLVRTQYVDDDTGKTNGLVEGFTIGQLYIDDVYFCDTLEDTTRNKPNTLPNLFQKILSRTAIPYGIYKVVLSFSNKFQKILPEVLNVPYYKGVRIHSGNKSQDTDGCILLGKNTQYGWVNDSGNTMAAFMKKLENQQSITINIVDEEQWQEEINTNQKETQNKSCLINVIKSLFKKKNS